MDKLKETSNSLNFKSHNFNSHKKYDNVSVKTSISKIKYLEEQENDENIFQEIEKLDNDNLSLAMQQFIDSLKDIKYVTYDDKKGNYIDIINIKLSNIALISILGQYCDIGYYPKSNKFYQDITMQLNKKGIGFKSIGGSLVFLQNNNLIILDEKGIKGVTILEQKNERLEDTYNRIFQKVENFDIPIPNYGFGLFQVLKKQLKT